MNPAPPIWIGSTGLISELRLTALVQQLARAGDDGGAECTGTE